MRRDQLGAERVQSKLGALGNHSAGLFELFLNIYRLHARAYPRVYCMLMLHSFEDTRGLALMQSSLIEGVCLVFSCLGFPCLSLVVLGCFCNPVKLVVRSISLRANLLLFQFIEEVCLMLFGPPFGNTLSVSLKLLFVKLFL